jgi:hypothetical protein
MLLLLACAPAPASNPPTASPVAGSEVADSEATPRWRTVKVALDFEADQE